MKLELSEATILYIEAGSVAKWLPKEASAIVVATNKNVMMGSNTDIFTAAGPELASHCESLQAIKTKKKWAKCHTGEAIITPGFDLQVGKIIHTVVPQKDRVEADAFLARCFSSCLAVARANGIENIAFPPLGAAEFPVEEIAVIAFKEIKSQNDGFKEIYVLVDEKDLGTWERVIAEVLEGNEPPPAAAAARGGPPPAAAVARGELLIIYSEAVIRWPVPAKLLSVPTAEFLYEEDFRVFREKEFKKFGIPDTVLTKSSVHPEGYSKENLKKLVDAKGVLLFEPLSSTRAQDLLSNQAREYQALLKKDPSIGIKDKTNFKAQVRTQKVQHFTEMKQMKEKLTTLELSHGELKKLQSTVDELKTELAALGLSVDRLKGKDAMLCRKMLERSREKASAHLVANRIPVPAAWNDVVVDPDCVQALQAAGLSQKALNLTKLGRFTLQQAGNEEAHNIYEPPTHYSEMINKNYTGDTRDALLELHQAAGLSQKALNSTKLGRFTLQQAGNEEAHNIYEPPTHYSEMINKNYTGDTRDALFELHQYCFV